MDIDYQYALKEQIFLFKFVEFTNFSLYAAFLIYGKSIVIRR